jgi:hypothetical protein
MELGDREKEMDMLRQELKAVRGICKTSYSTTYSKTHSRSSTKSSACMHAELVATVCHVLVGATCVSSAALLRCLIPQQL